MDDNELFSCKGPEDESSENTSLDLNSFSQKAQLEEKDKSKKKKGNKKQAVIKTVLTVFLVCIITGSIVVGTFILYAFTMVDATMDEDLNNLKLNFTTTIYVDNGDGYEEYQRLHGEFNRIWVAYDKAAIDAGDENYKGIPQMLANAFVAIEDKRFFDHDGVDWKRTIGSFVNMFVPIYSSRQGGSTITQQLVKNLTGDNSQKPSRKVREIMRARFLESKYSKDVILECYLNTIAMGHGMYGVEVASNYYFGKSVNELTITECACLASIAKSPTYYAPDDYADSNAERRKLVLDAMYEQGYITKEECEKAKNEELKVVSLDENIKETDVNSYFVDALITQVVNDLCEKYGYEKEHAFNNFYSGGYKIYATLDPEVQASLEKVFTDKSNIYKDSEGNVLQAAMTVMDYSGNVVGLVGGIGEKNSNLVFNNATDAIRQPGSSIKPLSAYTPAIENNLITYSSVLNDRATNYNGWTPVNYDRSYSGNVTVVKALERSLNTIPVYLVNKLGRQKCYDYIKGNFGISTLTDFDIDLSPLGMGGTNGGITTLESAAAFAAFGNGGLYYEPILYTKVCDQKGKVILENKAEPKLAMSEDTATVMNHMLRQVVEGEKGTGRKIRSYISNQPIFAKTGTSNSNNDKWFVGGTPYYVAASWCGFSEQKAIPSSHYNFALQLWGSSMSKIHSGLKTGKFSNSAYAVEKYYCQSTGLLANDTCTSVAKGWYKKNNLPEYCTTHTGEPYTKKKKPKDEDKTTSETSSTASATSEITQ